MTTNPAIRPSVRTILVVDDDAAHVEVCAQVLRKAGYLVVTARDGAAGLRELATNDAIDLALLDIFMPEKDGFDFLNSVRRREPRIAVVVMSGGGLVTSEHEALEHARLLGATASLAKPFSEPDLLRVVAEALGTVK